MLNTLICHRLNDHESAETVAGWIGTKDTFNVTAQYDPKMWDTNLGSIRSDKTYVIHPESIKQSLNTGEAYCVSKVGKFGWIRLKLCGINLWWLVTRNKSIGFTPSIII